MSGYFNTARVRGAVVFPAANNGVLGKAAVFGGGWLEVNDDPSLTPVNGITMEMTVWPSDDPNCDAQNNYRVLLRKGDAYSLVLEETRGIRARVRVAGGQVRELYSGNVLPIGAWTKVTAEYDAPSGHMQIRLDDQVVADATFAAAALEGTSDKLTVGGIGTSSACPVGGNFAGILDEVSVSRVARHIETPPPPDAGATGDAFSDAGTTAETGSAGGCCDSGRSARGTWVLALLVVAGLRRRRR